MESIAVGGAPTAAQPPADEGLFLGPMGTTAESFGFESRGEGVLRGPSSLEMGPNGFTVLDSVRGELRRFAADGRPAGTIALPPSARHVVEAVGLRDGKTLLFERSESGHGMLIVDATGTITSRIPIPASVANDDADVSRLIVRGGTIYAETNGTGPLHAVATEAGEALPGTKTIDGVPTHDDHFLLSAGITNEDEGRAWINVSSRATGAHRWTKELRFADEATAVGFLDDDGHGHGWLVVLVGGKPGSFVDAAVCFDVLSGAILASHAVPVDDPPWQSFRDYSVGPGGELHALRRSTKGARVLSFACGAPGR